MKLKTKIATFVVAGLLLGAFGAILLATNIKKAIFGLEPEEIAWILNL